MRRNSRTPQRPLFNVSRPVTASWNWTLTYQIGSSGYVASAHVIARAETDDGPQIGVAHCDVSMYDDLSEVVECLVVEAMLASCEPNIFGETPSRRIVFSTDL